MPQEEERKRSVEKDEEEKKTSGVWGKNDGGRIGGENGKKRERSRWGTYIPHIRILGLRDFFTLLLWESARGEKKKRGRPPPYSTPKKIGICNALAFRFRYRIAI